MDNNDSTETTDVRLEGASDEDTQVLPEESREEPGAATAPDDSSTEAPGQDEGKEKRSWTGPIAVGAFLVVAIAAVALLLLTNLGDDRGGSDRTGGRGGEEQADWKVTSYSVGGKHPSGKHGKPPKAQARSLETLVRRWHDSVYLFPADLRADTQKYFSSGAAAAMRGSDLGLPESAKEIETKKRTARIGIEANGAKRAAAVVDIVATGQSSKGPFKTSTETRLWFERDGSSWKVIAFDVDQTPLPVEPRKDAGKGDRPKGVDGKSDKGGKADPKAGKGEKKK
ncbi:MAG: hypothetical protein M3198_16840 [Actinomycetota bacterium]|nr:hypothetical protein [Actinomycetota bacterium]